MLILEQNQTELRTARVTDGVVLIIRKGQISISLVLTPSQINKIIQDLKLELYHIEECKAKPIGKSLKEWKSNIAEKYGSREDI